MRIITRIACIFMMLLIAGATCRIEDYRKIPQNLEKNHYLKNKEFFISAPMTSIRVKVFDFTTADVTVKSMMMGNAEARIDSSGIHTDADMMMDDDMLMHLPALLISDINLVKSFAEVQIKSDSTIYIYKGDYTVELRKPRKFSEYMFYTDFTFRQKGQFMYLTAELDSIKDLEE